MEKFDIEQFKRDPDTKETSKSTYWNKRKKLLIKQNPHVGKPEIFPSYEPKVRAKALMQKKAVLDRLGK